MLIFIIVCILFVILIAHNIFVVYSDRKTWEFDNTRQEVDGEYYQEGKFWNIKTVGISPPIVVSFTSKDLIEQIAEVFSYHYGYGIVYNTLEQQGKLVYDVEHAKRYCKSIYVDSGP